MAIREPAGKSFSSSLSSLTDVPIKGLSLSGTTERVSCSVVLGGGGVDDSFDPLPEVPTRIRGSWTVAPFPGLRVFSTEDL